MGVTKPSSGHGAPDATKPERDNRHADGEQTLADMEWLFLLISFQAVVK